MSRENGNLLGEERFYVFDKLPDNVRQIGEQPETNRIYVEDYVVTYMHRIFREKSEKALVVFVGKRGEGAAQGCVFLYGAIEVELELPLWKEQFTAQVWDQIHQQVHEYFSGGEVLGWGCGVHIGNSQIKKAVAGIQRKHFSRDGQVLFFWEQSEEEESVCRWSHGSVQNVSGYMIYYGKNPKMQEYMLRGKKKESFEASYQDSVMENVRTVIRKKEKIKQDKKPAWYAASGILFILALLGAWLLVQSNRKIDSLESAIMTLSQTPVEESPSNKKEGKKTPVPEGKKKTTPASEAKASFEAFEKKYQSKAGETEGATSSPVPAEISDRETPAPKASKAPNLPTPGASSGEQGKKTQAGEKPQQSTTGKSSPAPASVPKVNSYVVQQGDTLSQIVWRQYHTTAYLEKIKKVNNIKNEDEIHVGQRIILPLYEK